jgi:hypothetical protein
MPRNNYTGPVFTVKLGGQRNSYGDGGCDWHPSCLQCPLEDCRYDVTTEMRMKAKRLEMDSIRELLKHQPLHVVQLETGYSKRHLMRLKSESE